MTSANFFVLFYIIFVTSLILYLIPSLKSIVNYNKFKNTNNFDYVLGFDLQPLLSSSLFLFFLTFFSWSSPFVSLWFGNLVFSAFQLRISYLIIFVFYFILLIYTSSFYFSNKEIFDFILVILNFFIWLIFLFFSNNLFATIFIIEVISTLIFLIIITSTFSSTYFYNNLNLNMHNYFNNATPFFFVQALMFFFWISLISSLNLFLSLIFFYLKFLTFDWYLLENIFFYIVSSSSLKETTFISFAWFNFLFCIFLKCGLVPFYFWKPVFFKGIPLHSLFFYISFFYFFLVFFFLTFLLIYLNEIFFYFININVLILLIGTFFLFFILCEAYYLKTFLAISSILNTLFVFLALNATNFSDFSFYL